MLWVDDKQNAVVTKEFEGSVVAHCDLNAFELYRDEIDEAIFKLGEVSFDLDAPTFTVDANQGVIANCLKPVRLCEMELVLKIEYMPNEVPTFRLVLHDERRVSLVCVDAVVAVVIRAEMHLHSHLEAVHLKKGLRTFVVVHNHELAMSLYVLVLDGYFKFVLTPANSIENEENALMELVQEQKDSFFAVILGMGRSREWHLEPDPLFNSSVVPAV